MCPKDIKVVKSTRGSLSVSYCQKMLKTKPSQTQGLQTTVILDQRRVG